MFKVLFIFMMALFVIFFIKCSDKITKNLLNKNDKSQLFTKQTHTKSKPHFLWILKPNWINYGGPYQIAEMKTNFYILSYRSEQTVRKVALFFWTICIITFIVQLLYNLNASKNIMRFVLKYLFMTLCTKYNMLYLYYKFVKPRRPGASTKW